MSRQNNDAARSEVDAQIAALEEQLRRLRTRRNTLAPIDALPEELLRQVFAECHEDWPDFEDTTWLAITDFPIAGLPVSQRIGGASPSSHEKKFCDLVSQEHDPGSLRLRSVVNSQSNMSLIAIKDRRRGPAAVT